MTDRRPAPIDSVTTELTLAVALEDTYTGGPARGDPAVEVTNADASFVRNPSGYRVLVDLPADPPTLELVAGGEAYLREQRSVDRSGLDPPSPLVTIELVPGPAYPFGGGVSLVRGVVSDGDTPVPNATVASVRGSDATRSDSAGEFALPITDLARDDIVTDDDGVRMVKPGGRDPTVEATHPDDGRTSSADVTLPVGGSASVSLEF